VTPEERSQRARIAALTRWSKERPAEQGVKMRAGFDKRFYDQVDAESPGLDEVERERRVVALRKLHFTQLAYKSAKAQAKKAGK